MQRLGRLRLHNHYPTLQFAQSATDRLVLQFVFHQLPVVHQRILAEEISVLVSSLLKQRRVVRHAYANLVADDSAVSTFAQSAAERLALQHERPDYASVVGTHICCLEEQYASLPVISHAVAHL